MTHDEWRRVKAIAADALDQPEAERLLFVTNACAGDADFEREVLSLVRSADTASALFETPAVLLPGAATAFGDAVRPRSMQSGARIGAYRIVQEIGRGGMGAVFLAERADGEFDQRVAVKFVGGVPSGSILQRFYEERRILATLDHPNIARLIDGGTSPDGFPYVMMEYVAGVPIDEFCDAHSLDVRARLELFICVCAGVQYAHQRLIVHRDLKARNILVSSDGTPKLLDFGIAKLLESNSGASDQTRTMIRAITPETASPEQVRGESVTTATDVYALGALLYRLLSGRSPYRLETQGETELLRAVCEQLPLPPSEVGRFAGARDLDLVVLKALRKEPERRYPTVSELADDLRRYLDGRPVTAAPDRRLYRARKFAVRHRWGLTAAAAVAITVVVGAAATARQAQIANRERARAEGRFDDVRQLVNSFMFEVHDAIQTLPGSTPARRLLVTRVLDYLDKVSKDSEAESRLQLEIAAAYQKVGDVQGNPYLPNLGDVAGAMASYRKALEITETLVARDPSPPNRAALAFRHQRLAEMAWAQGSFAEALRRYQVSVGLRDRLANEDVSDEAKRLDLSVSHYGVGQVLLRTGDYDGAVEAFSRAKALQEQVVASNPDNLYARRSAATSTAKLGDVMAAKSDHARALPYHTEAVRMMEAMLEIDGSNANLRRALSTFLYRVAVDRNETGAFEEALAAGRQALELQKPILELDPSNMQARLDAAVIRRVTGEAFARLGRSQEALSNLAEAETTLRAVLAVNHNDAENTNELALALLTRGEVQMAAGEFLKSLEAFRESAALLEGQSAREETGRSLELARERAREAERRLTARLSPAAEK